MKLICERDALVASLSHASRRAEHKSKIPILQQVLVEAADSKLSLTATDLDARTTATCPAEISAAGATTVSADRLARLVDGMPKGAQVTFEMHGVDLHVACGRSRYKLPTLPAADFPDMSDVTGGVEFTVKADDAKRLFAEPAVAIPSNEQRIYLSGGHLSQTQKGEIKVTGCDGQRLVQLALPNDVVLQRGYILPRTAMQEMVKLAAKGDLSIRCDDNRMEITCGNVVFKSKLVDATYPDTSKVIPDASQTFIEVARADFVAALHRLAGVEGERSSITISWKAGEAAIEMSSAGEGSGVEEVACLCDLADGQIKFARELLGGMIDVGGGERLQIHIKGPNDPVLIVDPADKGLTVVAMPLRA